MSKRILFLTPQLPYPLHQGTTLRNFGLISGLAERGHEISLLSFREAEQPRLEETPLPKICMNAQTIPAPEWSRNRRLRALLTGKADMARRRWSDEFRDTLRTLLDKSTFDVVHIEGIEMAPYLDILRQRLPNALIIYDAHNAEYALQNRIAEQDWQIPRRWPMAAYSTVQTRRLTRLETYTCRHVDHIIAVSDTDAGLLGNLDHHTPITVIPNAIFAESYNPDDWAEALIKRPSMIFTGKMDFRPNVDAAMWFAEEILPKITREIPDAHFTIVGQKPHTRLGALRDRSDVTLTGYVDDIRPYLKAADVYIAPLRMGSGTRFKLLEAMAMGRPVVSTRIGAEGLDVQNGDQMLLADSPEEFAAAVISLLRDEDRRVALGSRGRDLVRSGYDWHAIIPSVEAIYS